MICGDMNFRDINWEDISDNGSVDSKEFKFIGATTDAYIKQHIDKPTRGRGSVSPSFHVDYNEMKRVMNIDWKYDENVK